MIPVLAGNPPFLCAHLLALSVQLRSLLLDAVLQRFLSFLDDDGLLDHLGLGLQGYRLGTLALFGNASLSHTKVAAIR